MVYVSTLLKILRALYKRLLFIFDLSLKIVEQTFRTNLKLVELHHSSKAVEIMLRKLQTQISVTTFFENSVKNIV